MPNRRRSPPLVQVVALVGIAFPAAAQNPPSAPALFRSEPAAAAHIIPVSTSVPAAEQHFVMGMLALDAEQNPVALKHFEEAIKADGAFAVAHLYAAVTTPSLSGYKTHLDHAASRAAGASPAEQLLIRTEQSAFANDLNGRLEAAQKLVALVPLEPRAHRVLARAQAALRRTAEQRQALAKAIELSPDFAALHVELGNSYTLLEPRNLNEAAVHIRHALALDPNASYVHDYMGDLYRATNELDKARAEYTRVIELSPESGLGFVQRGHVNTLIGNYPEARSDYDRAIGLADATVKPGFMAIRALVSAYAGDPASAEKELEDVFNAIDGIGHPNPNGAKIANLNDQLLIAAHHKHFDVAQRAVDRLAVLWQKQAEIAGTPAMRGLAAASTAYNSGMLAIRKGDFAAGRARAKEYMNARQAENNPRKNEGAHALLAMADLFEGKAESAIPHFAEIPPENIYFAYYRAVALKKAGRAAEARPLFEHVANWNFTTAGVALTRKEAASNLK